MFTFHMVLKVVLMKNLMVDNDVWLIFMIFIFYSLSMKGEKFSIAKGVAKTVINTLTKQDYVNVVCARASHWDQVGK